MRLTGTVLFAGFFALAGVTSVRAEQSAKPIKAGMIGLDAHALSWTKIVNNPKATGELADMIIVAGYPGGSPDIPQSMELLNRSIEPIRKMNVEIVDSTQSEVVKGVLMHSLLNPSPTGAAGYFQRTPLKRTIF